MRDATYRPKISGMLVAFFAFLGVMALATIFAENPLKSFWSNYERMEGYVTLLHLFAMFIVAGHVINTRALWDRLFATSLGVSYIVCIYAFLQLVGKLVINQGGVRVDATFGNATYLAIYLVVHIFLAIIFMLRNDQKLWVKMFSGVLILMQVFVLYHTATRGAILGLIGGVLLMSLLIAFFEERGSRLRKVSYVLIGSIATLVVVFMLVRNTNFVAESPVLSRFSNISFNETKTQARAYVWPMAIKGFSERPVLGWGQENFNYVFNKYYDPRMYRHEPWFDRTHNVVLDWLISGGLLGLFGYLSLFALAMYAIWRKGDLSFAERSALTGLFAAYFFHNLFVFDNITSYILFVMLLAYLHFDTAKEFNNKISLKVRDLLEDPRKVNGLYSPIVAVLIIASIYFFNAKPIAANTTLIKAISQGTAEERINNFKRSLSYDTLGNQEIREQLVQFAFGVVGSNALSAKQKEEVISLAKTEYEKMIEEAPNDTRHRLFYGVLMNVYGQYDVGLQSLLKASELSPEKQTIIIEIANTYIILNNYDEALKYYKKAYDLDPTFEDAVVSYAIGAIYGKKEALANEILMNAFGTTAYPDNRLINAYKDNRQFSKVVEIWQEQAKKSPNDARIRAMLAGAYFDAGQRGDALRELIKARELESDPERQRELDSAIVQVRSGN